MNRNPKDKLHSPIEASGNYEDKKYFTAEESMAFLEPRIRAMFR